VPRLRLRIAYQGTRYAGWQLQAHTGVPQPPTIQGELERAVVSVLDVPRIPIVGCSRTDSGVHAEDQICRLDIPAGAERINWLRVLNSRLPEDIRVLEAALVADDFEPRRGVLFKCYSYALWTGPARPLPRIAPFVGAFPSLNFDRVDAVLPYFVGKRDWRCMQNAGAQPMENTVRTVFSVTRKPHFAGPLRCPEDWPVHAIFVEGDGFLKQMVRNMIGLIVRVGLGKIEPDAVPGLLARPRREDISSPTAPPSGLTLMHVAYGNGAPPQTPPGE
jgi:tRNA pseudouridine38-40 synthase